MSLLCSSAQLFCEAIDVVLEGRLYSFVSLVRVIESEHRTEVRTLGHQKMSILFFDLGWESLVEVM